MSLWGNADHPEFQGSLSGKNDDYVDAWSQAVGELSAGVDHSMFDHPVDVFAGLPPGYRYGW